MRPARLQALPEAPPLARIHPTLAVDCIKELAGRPAVGMRALTPVAAGCGLAGSHPLRVSLEHARLSTPTGLHFRGSIAVGGSGDEQQGEEEGSIALGMEEPSQPRRLWLPDQSGPPPSRHLSCG